MRQYVIGNDIDDISWSIFSKFEYPEDFENAQNIRLVARHADFPTVVVDCKYEKQGNVFSIVIPAEVIKRVGIYDLELTYQKPDQSIPGDIRSCRVTYCKAFEVVSKSCEVILPTDPLEIAGIIAPLRGYSAYEVFVKNGFEGTEAEWELFIRKPAIDAAATALESAQLADQARQSIQAELKAKPECIVVSEEEYNDL